ncbi:serine/arginine repetitive matrix protein 2-like [Littorina saxatilis]|uniref:Uncharacterized protein n=1 Tax=Littorina saxatilis TaxID=31220 RepID=A0AAN9BNB3_9CAEN
MFSRLQSRRSNLQDLGHLSKSCPSVDKPALDRDGTDEESFGGSTASLSDAFSESSEEASPPISRKEQQLARNSLRRAKQREVEQQRNMEENKISMDDYLGKQAQFRLWLQEEQRKQSKELSSPKRKTYFKMFVRLWNKRHLPDKYYESRLSHHWDEEEGVTPTEPISPLDPNGPRFSLLQNSPALDPSIFPHCVDLSSDSLAVGSPATPFSTFGKATPSSSLTPLRISANDCVGTESEKSVMRKRDVFMFGGNKENNTQSLPITATPSDVLRTAKISPRKKMISACTDRSLDRVAVRWSPRGAPKLNIVNAPRCPSPFARHLQASQSEESAKSMPSGPRQVSTLPRFLPQYQRVKDFVPSPTYAEIPGEAGSQVFAFSPGQKISFDKDSIAKQPKPKGYRRRSRSVDEIPMYAVPSRHGAEKLWSEKQTAVTEAKPLSPPPPVPPKRFDPHVEGLGIPFSPVVMDTQALAGSMDDVGDDAAKKSVKKLFKGKLPWFGKKLTSSSRRRSRSCEVLSPLPSSAADVRSKASAQNVQVSQFPLMEMERSPTFGRKFLTRPNKLPDKQANDTQKMKVGQTTKFELMDYTSSPMRPGFGGALARQPSALGAFERVKSIRRRSKSMEMVNSPFLSSFRSKGGVVFGEKVQLGQQRSTQKPADTDKASFSPFMQKLFSVNQQPPEIPHNADKPEDTANRGSMYEEIKSDIRSKLSSMVSKMQNRSSPESDLPPYPDTPMEVDASMELGKLQSSPQRLGQKQQGQIQDLKDEIRTATEEMRSTPYGNAIRAAARRYLPTSQAISSYKEPVSHPSCSQDLGFSAPVPAMHEAKPGSCHVVRSLENAENNCKMPENAAATERATLSSKPDQHHNGETERQPHLQLEPHAVNPQNTAASCLTARDQARQYPEAPSHRTNDLQPNSSTTDSSPESSAATGEKSSMPVEIPSYREPVRPPPSFTEVVFSQPVSTTKQASGVCQPLSAVPPSFADHGESPTWSSPYRVRHPQRRRSRSVGDTVLPVRFGSFREAQQKDQAEATPCTPSRATVIMSFTPSIPVLPAARDGESQALAAPCAEDSKPPALLLQALAPATGNGSASESEHVSEASASVSKGRPQQNLPRETHQVFGEQQSKTVTSEQFPPDKQQAQMTANQSTQGTEKNQQKQQAASNRKAPQPTASCKKPPQVAAKPPVKQTTSEAPESQDSTEKGTSVPSVKSILQKFGGSFRGIRQSSRRRSRSMGDVSAFQDKDENSPAQLVEEAGGFSNVKAFWDRLRGKGGGEERPKVPLQRKPSTLKRLQQQLEKEEEKDVPGKVEAAPPEIDDHPNPFRSAVLPTSPVVAADDSLEEVSTQSVPTDNGGASPALAFKPKSPGLPGSKAEETGSETPVKTSPFVTVRRRSSRKRTVASPCTNATPQFGKPLTESSYSRDERNEKESSNAFSSPTPTTSASCSSSAAKPTPEVVSMMVQKEETTPRAQFVDAEVKASSTKAYTSPEEDASSTTITPEAPLSSPLKKPAKAPPPKPLPKPKIRPPSVRQKPGQAMNNSPQSSPVAASTGVSRARKRRSQEMDQVSIPEKVSAAGKVEHRGPVTRSMSQSQIETQNDCTMAPQANGTQDTDGQKKSTESSETLNNAAKPAKRRSNDAADNEESSPTKRSNDARPLRKLPALPRRQSSEKEVSSPTVQRQASGKTPQNDSPLVKRTSSGKTKQDSPMVKRQSSGKARKDSPMVKRQSSGKESHTSSPAVRRISSGKTQQSPRRRSSGRVSITKSGSIAKSGSITKSSSQRRQGSIVSRENVNVSAGRHRGRVNTPEPAGASGRETPIQNGNNEKSAYPCGPGRQAGAGVREQPKISGPVKRLSSTRAESMAHTASSLVKRFNSLREETKSSKAKRRSGVGGITPKRTSTGGRSAGGTTPKRTSSGRGKSPRDSGRVKRTDSKRRERSAEDDDSQGDTASRTDSFKKQTSQSPTFMKITRRLGAFDEDCSDDSFNVVQDLTGDKKVLLVNKIRATSNSGSDSDNASQQTLPRSGCEKQDRAGKAASSTTCVRDCTPVTDCSMQNRPPVSTEPKSRHHLGNDTEVETDIDMVTVALEPRKEKVQRRKRTIHSTLV